MEKQILHYFTTTVKYIIGGRRFIGDEKGFVLTERNPYISVKDEDLRDFKLANKEAFVKGLMVPTKEPAIEWDTPNAITDEKAAELVKLSYMSLKAEVSKITSLPHMAKIVELAKDEDRPNKTIRMLEERLKVLADKEQVQLIYRDDMPKGGAE